MFEIMRRWPHGLRRKPFFMVALFAPLALLSVTNPVIAQSKAAQWLTKNAISEGCSTQSGRFESNGVMEQDLTGDGRADLILDFAGLRCSSGLPMFCGAKMCSIRFYVRNGQGLLKPAGEVLSVGAQVVPGNPPGIQLIANDNSEHIWRWNGRKFGK